ncbi:MAG TPA: hypothetical protein VGK40_10820 [Verrucomicrobiae bacterium]|jgi:hypothetical protein
MSDYIPTNDTQELRGWIAAFLAALPTYGPEVGLTAADQAALNRAGNAAIDGIDKTVTQRNQYDSALANRQALVRSFIGLLRPMVRRAKASANYTPSVGEHLGVVADNPPIDPKAVKPSLTLTVHMGFVRVRVKRNGAESVGVFCRKSGQADWTFLARATRAVYDDQMPLAHSGVPELREYRVQGFIGDTQVGQPSDPKLVVFAGAMAA